MAPVTAALIIGFVAGALSMAVFIWALCRFDFPQFDK